jgi:hypothetical protein
LVDLSEEWCDESESSCCSGESTTDGNVATDEERAEPVALGDVLEVPTSSFWNPFVVVLYRIERTTPGVMALFDLDYQVHLRLDDWLLVRDGEVWKEYLVLTEIEVGAAYGRQARFIFFERGGMKLFFTRIESPSMCHNVRDWHFSEDAVLGLR